MHIQVKMPSGRPTSCLAHSTCRPRRALAYRLPQLLARVAGRSLVPCAPRPPRKLVGRHTSQLTSPQACRSPRGPQQLTAAVRSPAAPRARQSPHAPRLAAPQARRPPRAPQRASPAAERAWPAHNILSNRLIVCVLPTERDTT
jgi:hypothetical protein